MTIPKAASTTGPDGGQSKNHLAGTRDCATAIAASGRPPIQQTFDVEGTGDLLIDERRLAALWGCSPKTLRNQRSLGTGCPFVRIGRLVRYRLAEVRAYEKIS